MLTKEQVEDGITKATGVTNSLRNAYYPSSNNPPTCIYVGSWGKSTQVRLSDDVDIMFELPASDFHRFSQRTGNVQSTLLQEVKDQLISTYPNSEMRGDGQVVQIRFNTIAVEVIPVFRLTNGQFYMPDTNEGGRWKVVDPFAEIHGINTLDQVSNGNVRALSKMMKHWKREMSVPLKSFQIELLVQEFMTKYPYRNFDFFWYDWFVRDFFEFLLSKVNQTIVVPGTNEIIYLGLQWYSRAVSARDNALKACSYEYYDYDITAGQEWQKIFGNRIPVRV